jgi:hypothetical protein
MDVKKIYYIIHPAFPVGEIAINVRKDPKEVSDFIKAQIVPIIKKAQSEPNSIVVLLRSTYGFPAQERNKTIFRNFKPDRSHQIEAVKLERNLRNLIINCLGNRSIILRTKKGAEDEKAAELAAKEFKKKMSEKGMHTNPKTSMEAKGSWWELCVAKFSEVAYQELGIKGRLRIPKKGCIKHTLDFSNHPTVKSRFKRIRNLHRR